MRDVRAVLLMIIGSISVIFGLIGIFIPVLPTTPFLLLAAFCYARSSNRALDALMNNRWFGAYIRNYREGRGMSLYNKVFTLTMLWLTIGASILFVLDNLWVRLILIIIASGVTFHLLRVKTYRPELYLSSRDGEVDVEQP